MTTCRLVVISYMREFTQLACASKNNRRLFLRQTITKGLSMKTIPQEIIQNKIFVIRGKKGMFDKGLAELYGAPTKSLNLAVKRNLHRLPDDFRFRLTPIEAKSLRFQSETSKKGRGGRRYLPYVFTQEGIAMLSSVLHSERAIQVNIQQPLI